MGRGDFWLKKPLPRLTKMPEATSMFSRGKEAMTRFLWDQWCSVGIGAHFQNAPVGFAIDLEALILASSEWGFDDARLRNESADWLTQFGKLVSVQRLKSLRSLYQFGDDNLELGDPPEPRSTRTSDGQSQSPQLAHPVF